MNPALVPSAESDTELLRRYASANDPEAFSKLVRRYARFVFSIARRITGDSDDADDVSQQCFLELARRAATISGSLGGWLHRVACSRSLNLRRDRATRQAHERQSVPPPQSRSASEPTWVELEPLIDDAIAALPNELRLPLVLHYLQEKTQAEVAAECGVEQSTISRRLSEGVEVLRESLREGGIPLSTTVLATRLQSVPVHIPPPALIASLTKVGLAGVGQAGWVAGKTALAKWVLAAMALVTVGIAAVVLLQMRSGSGQSIQSPASPLQAVLAKPEAVVVDTLSRPVSNAYIDASLTQIWYGARSDTDGRFDLADSRIGRNAWVWSQRSRKLALFSVPQPLPALPVQVVLRWNEARADGVVTNPSGAPIPHADVVIQITMPDGAKSSVTAPPTDDSGYYDVQMVPSGPGVMVRATLSSDPGGVHATPWIDSNGQFQIEFPDMIDRTGLHAAAHPGPKRQRYAGRVMDESGADIAGAKVSLWYPYRHMIAMAGDVLTDGNGRFTRLMPPGAGEVQCEISHPDFISQRPRLDETAMLNGSAVFVMQRGVAVSGTVRDPAGKPVCNALVLGNGLNSTTPGPENEPIEDSTMARTDWQGRFRIGGLPGGRRTIEVLSDQFAPRIVDVDLEEKTASLDVSLDPGITCSAVVVDVSGMPLAGANVGCGQWRTDHYSGPLSRFTKTDTQGRFTLKQLPSQGQLQLYASKKGLLGMQFNWRPGGKNEDRITLYAPPVITGIVHDANTDRPITKFDVVPGWYWKNSDGFVESDFDGVGHVNSPSGRFSKKIQRVTISEDLPAFAVRIEAKGYAAQYSPKVYPGKRYDPFVIRLTKSGTTTQPSKATTN